MNDITQVLNRLLSGNDQAASELIAQVYAELRQLAARKMAHKRAGHTLQPTALAHEVWLRLGADAQPNWQNRAHFFAAAAEAMRRILVESARRRARLKRGGDQEHLDVDELEIAIEGKTDDRILQVNEALEKYATIDPRKANLVKLRYFGGLIFEEAAQVLGITVSTAKEWWSYVRAWLSVEMGRPHHKEG